MDPITNTILGLLFFGISVASTLLMFHLWGYPFDHDTLTSSAPPRLMRLHRWLGYAYVAIYVVLMSQMVPRLWAYQVEFPPRTVAHLTLGMAIGVIVVIKISIVRYFKHLESSTVPLLGILLLISTTLLIGLSAPFALQEEFLSRAAHAGQSVFAPDNVARVTGLLESAGIASQQQRSALAAPASLRAGRMVLSKKCVQCHDLRTILARPQPPQNWRQVVSRMAGRSVILNPITEPEQLAVTAYLIAISPQLQAAVKQQRAETLVAEQTRETAARVRTVATVRSSPSADPVRARRVYETKCVQCHSLATVQAAPPQSEEQARVLVARMVNNGLTATEEEMDLIVRHLLTMAVK